MFKITIETQTKALEDQVRLLEKLKTEGSDEKYLLELEKYHLMLKGSDFSIKAQAESKRKKLTRKDKILAPIINKVTRQVNKLNDKLGEHNKKNI